ncbi:hypothetical protein BDV39DRAFT_198187 [Aspergillus sergii]|uniref:FAD linked oxidase N-terminal domain-containing protein n=1 Tax=Aspergillus sergii TaxID=1034303 RepID=A0A5N6WIT3_9EURO|nr:hypothetical protein BDV39DRAFT_198187 [Aspergillus sergii]
MRPLARYAVNVTSALDEQKVLHCTHKRNIPVVIRNAGHNYMGEFTGPGAVALWAHHRKSIEYVPEYASTRVQGFEAQNAAPALDSVIVTGHCADIGIAGGSIQGGGHGFWSGRL